MATGIIAEFNPFHNGHKYLLEKAKDENGVVAVMSGSFVQRGDIAITDKWTRAGMALDNGADLVIELPVIYSLNTAQKFALGAVLTLAATGIINRITFGSESGNTDAIKKAAFLTANEPETVSLKIKELIKTGINYPSARAKAYKDFLDSEILSTPNDILGVEYIRAAIDSKFNCEFCAVERKGVSHDSHEINGSVASASQIRNMIRKNTEVTEFIPGSYDFPIYSLSRLDTAITAKLRTCGSEYLKTINDVSEGLENRFISAAAECDTFEEICSLVKSKRYTLSRIRRIALSSYIGLTKELASLAPSYIRVLGMNDKGKELLKQMKKTASIPVVIKSSELKNDKIFKLNNSAEDVFSLCCNDKNYRKGGRDFTVSPVIV